MTDVHFALQNKHLCPHVYYLETRQGYQEIFFFYIKDSSRLHTRLQGLEPELAYFLFPFQYDRESTCLYLAGNSQGLLFSFYFSLPPPSFFRVCECMHMYLYVSFKISDFIVTLS